MLKDTPYSTLKQDGRAYEILLLRDQYGHTFSDIGKAYQISAIRARQIYSRQKYRQIRLYMQHIAFVQGHESMAGMEKLSLDAMECYQDAPYVCAYLEKEYGDILTAYREGEPGMPAQFIRSVPPLRAKFSDKTIARVIEMREGQKASFIKIAKELRMTQAKAERIYEMFYHKKLLALLRVWNEKENDEAKTAYWESCLSKYQSAKKRYDFLVDISR